MSWVEELVVELGFQWCGELYKKWKVDISWRQQKGKGALLLEQKIISCTFIIWRHVSERNDTKAPLPCTANYWRIIHRPTPLLNKTGETWILKDRREPRSNRAIRLLTFPETACFMRDWRISNFGLDFLNEISSENLPCSCFWNTVYKCYPPQSFKRCDLKKKRNLHVKHFLIWLVKKV